MVTIVFRICPHPECLNSERGYKADLKKSYEDEFLFTLDGPSLEPKE